MNTQNAELTKVKNRIRALSNKTVERGCSEHEAMEAMAAVGRLLAQFNLTMNEVDVREQVCKTIYIKTNGQRRGPIDGCISALGNLFQARVWFSSKYENLEGHEWKFRKVTSYAFFGTETDLEMIQYLYDIISSAIEAETAAYKRTEEYKAAGRRKSATVSFGHGMAHRISRRLSDMKDAVEAETAAHKDTTGTALVVLKGQLINEEFKNLGISLRTVTSTRKVSNYSAYDRGQQAGNKVNLSRPITGGSKVSGYLT